MLVLVTYDVQTSSISGEKRLRKVARQCVNYGQRVQNSVFECVIDYGEVLKLKNILKNIINEKTDSLRFYNLGNSYSNKVEHIGIKASIPLEGTIII